MKKTNIFLIGILILCFITRFYRFNNPIADWHSWRQADTSAVSRNFIKHGFDVLHPTFDDLSNVASGIDNPHGYRFVEFPIYNLLQAGLFAIFHLLTLEGWGRLVTIFSSVFSTLLLYVIVRKYAEEKTALFTAFFYAFIPFNIYYGRVILPDPLMVTMSLAGIYFFCLGIDKKNKKRTIAFFGSAVFTSLALLLKPYAAFFALPMVYLAFTTYKLTVVKQWRLWLYALIAFTPFILWRWWIAHFPEGIPAYNWLFNGNGIRFRPAFFRWILYERLTKLISGYTGIVLVFSGVYSLRKVKNALFFLSFFVASIVYVTVLATGNVQHDYYQILIMPSIAICMGFGAEYFVNRAKRSSPTVWYTVLTISILGMLYFGWHYVKDYFNINNPSIVIAGKIVDEKTPKNAKVIALYDGDTSFLYQTNRQGWASLEKPLPELIKLGASYMIIPNPQPQDLSGFGKEYKIVASSSAYLLLQLQ